MAGVITFLAILLLSLVVAVLADRRFGRLPISVVAGFVSGAVLWFAATMFFYSFVSAGGD